MNSRNRTSGPVHPHPQSSTRCEPEIIHLNSVNHWHFRVYLSQQLVLSYTHTGGRKFQVRWERLGLFGERRSTGLSSTTFSHSLGESLVGGLCGA